MLVFAFSRICHEILFQWTPCRWFTFLECMLANYFEWSEQSLFAFQYIFPLGKEMYLMHLLLINFKYWMWIPTWSSMFICVLLSHGKLGVLIAGIIGENFSLSQWQNHRIVTVESDLWRSSGPTPMLRQNQLEQLTQKHMQLSFDYLQTERQLIRSEHLNFSCCF